MRLKDLREDADLPQRELAEFLHIRQNTYSQYESGARQIPLPMLVRLSEYFSTSVDYLLGLTDVKDPYPRKTSRLE
ncbi:MAG: helix-turn-helix transcriptional regulator [Clostridia bacterium]|nr:helix-turn-helix transcriptional regulator [Clostridia bacterium]